MGLVGLAASIAAPLLLGKAWEGLRRGGLLPQVTSIYIFPVKSLRGVPLEAALVDETGLVGDRRMMVVDAASGNFVSQRNLPRMSLVDAKVDTRAGTLVLSAPGRDSLLIDISHMGEFREVMVWGEVCGGYDLGQRPAEWLSAFLEQNVRLVHFDSKKTRPIPESLKGRGPEPKLAFPDGFPLLLTSEASMEDLNAHIPQGGPLPILRFRGNIVINGTEPWIEDCYKVIRIGDVVFDCVKACTRCSLTTVDYERGVKTTEPLRTLKERRTRPGISSPLFGINMIQRSPGSIKVGDQVEILEWWGKDEQMPAE